MQNNRGTTGSYTLSISVPEDDHGNSRLEATEIVVPYSMAGVIEYVGDQDYFSFQAQAGTAYLISTTQGTSGQFPSTAYTAVYNEFGQQLPTRPYGPIYTTQTSETLYIMVQNNRGSTGPYTLSVQAPEDDHGNAISTATAVAVPSSTKGVIEYAGDADYFSFPVQAGGAYLITASEEALGEITVAVVNSQNRQLTSGQTSTVYAATDSMTVYIVVQNNRGRTSSYTLSLSVPDDDHGNTTSSATVLESPFSRDGSIDYAGDLDYFSFQTQAGTTYVITAAGGTSEEFIVRLFFPPSASPVARVAMPISSSISYTATASETLYVVVENRNRRTGAYTLAIFVLGAEP